MECPYCKKEFVPWYSWVKYCSKECRLKQRRIRDRPKKLIQDRKYYYAHQKEFSRKSKIWRQNNKQHKYETDKKYRLTHIDKHNEQNRLWRKRHPEKNRLIQYNNYWKNARYNIQFKIARSLRSRIRTLLKGKHKSAHTLELLGCSIDECWKYLQNKFKPGMTKENYGTVWNLDHIRPCASFNLEETSEQQLCFHYTNLQPLFVEENRKKGSKY